MNNTAEVLIQKRLLLGIAPIDAVNSQHLPFPVRIDLENQSPHQSELSNDQYSHIQYPVTKNPKGFSRHPSGRFSLHYSPSAADQVQIRIYDLHRRYVPRRFLLPLVTLQQMLEVEQNESADYLDQRVRFPALFPGAAYPVHTRVTGVRGRILHNDEPLRWAMIEARSSQNGNQIVARAKGDDRGEFLLHIPPLAVPDVSLTESFSFDLVVWARPQALVPVPSDIAGIDPYWDAPIEVVVDNQPDDAVSSGFTIPSDYVQSQTTVLVSFQLARMLNSLDVVDIIFNPP